MTPEPALRSCPEVSNEESYRALVQRLSTFVWIADQRGEFSAPQPGWEKYTGHGFDQHGGTGWISDVHPDDRAHVASVWNRAVQSKSWYEVSWRCWHGATQSWRQCTTRGVPVVDKDGLILEWIGAVLDIQDRAELKRSQDELASANRELGSNLQIVTRLQQLSTRLIQSAELKLLLGEIIETALELTRADKGSIQLFQDGLLPIMEQRGFDAGSLDFFNSVEYGKAVCGTVLDRKERVIVENVATSPIFAETATLGVFLSAQVHAFQSTPLVSRSGELLGVFSTHYSIPQAPKDDDLRMLDIVARQAADLIERDVAEQTRKQAQEALALSLRAGKAGTFDWDAQRDINRWSDELLELYGIKRDEFGESTQDWRAAVFPEDKERAFAALERSLETGIFDVDFRIVRRDNGQVRWMHGAGQVFFEDGKPARMLGINVDITEQKRVEEQLRQSEARFNRLVESNIVGIIIANEKRIIDANPLYLNMLGYSREDLLAGRVDWVKATPPDSYEKDIQGLRQLRERGICVPYEKEYIRTDGTRIPILIGAAALPGYAELTWICFVVDLSEQKSLQNALASTNEQLVRANKDLEQFAYSASHDLQEPLRSIKIYSELLTMRCGEKLDGESLQALDFVRSGASRMELLLRGLLTYTQALRFESTAEPIDAGTIVETTLKNIAGAISESSAKVEADPLPSVRVHDTQLQQLFQNLIANAIKYRKPGLAPVIHISANKQNGEWWRFAVKDNGIGIDPEFKERIFGLFKRLHTNREYAGAGIGLALCQRIVEQYNGRIWVESEQGNGSTFYFTLPA